MLNFKPHHMIDGCFVAKAKGCSIIHGTGVRGYEIMDREGDVSSGHTLEQVKEYLNALL